AFRKRKLAPQHRVHEREHRGVCADPERQHQNRQRRESAALPQRSESVTKILEEGIHRKSRRVRVTAGYGLNQGGRRGLAKIRQLLFGALLRASDVLFLNMLVSANLIR